MPGYDCSPSLVNNPSGTDLSPCECVRVCVKTRQWERHLNAMFIEQLNVYSISRPSLNLHYPFCLFRGHGGLFKKMCHTPSGNWLMEIFFFPSPWQESFSFIGSYLPRRVQWDTSSSPHFIKTRSGSARRQLPAIKPPIVFCIGGTFLQPCSPPPIVPYFLFLIFLPAKQCLFIERHFNALADLTAQDFSILLFQLSSSLTPRSRTFSQYEKKKRKERKEKKCLPLSVS